MNARLVVPALVSLTALQLVIGRLAPDFGARVDLFMILVASVARSGARPAATLCGAVAGSIEDALSGDLFGLNGFAKTSVGYLLAAVSTRILVSHPIGIALCLFGGVVANALVVSALRFLLAQSGAGASVAGVGSRALLTALVGLLLSALARYPWRERWRAARMRRLRS